MALKMHHNDFLQAANKVTPDEIGWTQHYSVINPSIGSTWFGTCAVAGTSAVKPVVLINGYADYPRNVRCVLNGSAVGMSGTFVINGYDQFGNTISESMSFGSADNGGTVIGTKVFAQVTSGTCNMGTAVGSGTTAIGVGTAGTTTLFGLPARLGGSTDIKTINGCFTGVGTQTAGTFVFGGTPSSAANTVVHAFKAPADVAAGTVIYNVRYVPTFVEPNETVTNIVL